MTMQFCKFLAIAWPPVGLVLITFVGLIGLVAVLSPRHFRLLARFSGQWVSPDRFLQLVDRRVDIDGWFLDHSRIFGAILLTAIAAVAYFAFRLH